MSVPMKDCMPIATCSGAMAATKPRNSSSDIRLAGPVDVANSPKPWKWPAPFKHIVDIAAIDHAFGKPPARTMTSTQPRADLLDSSAHIAVTVCRRQAINVEI